jgi:serine/threonine protein phosphatase 1
MRIWMNNGCDYTYQQFQELSPADQEDLLQYLESLSVQTEVEVDGKQYVLVHAAPMELYYRLNRKYADPKEFAVWHRLRFEKNLLEDKAVILGHTPTKYVMAQVWPTMRIFHNNDAINIDCGCAYPGLGGQLGCLRLEDMTEFYSAEGVVTVHEAADWKRNMQKKGQRLDAGR